MSDAAPIHSALNGIRVIDFTGSIAGPYCGLILASFGADVIKVEQPGRGDDIRSWAPPYWGTESASFLGMNAGKRSIELDLKSEEGLTAASRLVAGADVVLQAWRPGVAERLHLGFDDLVEVNPRVILGSVSAFGQTGPLAAQPGYDPLAQAMTGIMSLTGERDGKPVRCGISAADQATGMWLTIGVLLALRARDATDKPQRVDTSLFETGIGWVAYRALGYLANGDVPRRSGSSIDFVAPYQAFAASDGDIMVAVANDRMFRDFASALGEPGWVTDDRFATNAERVAHRDELAELIARPMRSRSVAEWLEILRATGVPSAPILDVDAAIEQEQTRALGIIQPVDHPRIPDFRLVSLPLQLNREYPRYTSAPPALGEHTEEVLAEVGLGAAPTSQG